MWHAWVGGVSAYEVIMCVNTKERDNVEDVGVDGWLVFKRKNEIGWEAVHCVYVYQIRTNAGFL